MKRMHVTRLVVEHIPGVKNDFNAPVSRSDLQAKQYLNIFLASNMYDPNFDKDRMGLELHFPNKL